MLSTTIDSMSEEKDKNLINFIATTVETMRDQMATKDDLARVESSVASVESRVAQVESSAPRRIQPRVP